MESWLASHALEVIFATVVLLSSGGVGFTKRLRRQLKECRAKCRKVTKDYERAERNYAQSLEFNLQDRFTIRELAKMVSTYRAQLNLPEGDFLLEILLRAEAEQKVRRLQAGIHVTSSSHGAVEETFSDE